MTMMACVEPVLPLDRLAPAPQRRAIATAPMRVSFAGGGTDLPPFHRGIGVRVVGTAIGVEEYGAEVVRTCGAGDGGHVLVWAPPDRHPAIAAALNRTVRKPALAAAGVRIEAE